MIKKFLIWETMNLSTCEDSSTDTIKSPKKIRCQVSFFYLSYIRCQVSHVRCHLSHVTNANSHSTSVSGDTADSHQKINSVTTGVTTQI